MRDREEERRGERVTEWEGKRRKKRGRNEQEEEEW